MLAISPLLFLLFSEHLQYASLAWPLLKVNGTMVFDDYAWE